jgi:hypothetical protein
MKKKIKGTSKYIGVDGYVYSEAGNRYCRYVDNTGYYQTSFSENKKKRYFRIHRLLAIAFIENPDGLSSVNHIDGNKLNNDIRNLEWSSNKKNTKHAYDMGLYESTYKCCVVATHKKTSVVYEFRSVRACADELKINRKTLTGILKKQKANNYEYYLEYKV